MKHLIVCLSAFVAFMSLLSCNGGISREDLNGTWLSCQIIEDGEVMLCGQQHLIPTMTIVFNDERVGVRFFARTHWGTYDLDDDHIIASFDGRKFKRDVVIESHSDHSLTLYLPHTGTRIRLVRVN